MPGKLTLFPSQGASRCFLLSEGMDHLAGRELFMLILTQVALRKGMDLKVNMLGRWAVWPVMSALALSFMVETWATDVLMYIGLAMTLAATVMYVQDGVRHLRGQGSRPSS